MCGRRSKTGLKGIVIGSFLLLLAAFPCYSASSWAVFTSGDTEKEAPIVTIEEPIAEEESQNSISGETQATASTEPSAPSEALPTATETAETAIEETQPEAQTATVDSAITKVQTAGFWISSEDKAEIENALVDARDNLAVLKEASDAKDAEIADLKEDLSVAEGAAGTRPYLMLDGIIGFENTIPTYGVGLTLGTRIGNHIMLELGADYTIGKFTAPMSIKQFSIDNFEFRASVGWMF